jgi:hypothetical protein
LFLRGIQQYPVDRRINFSTNRKQTRGKNKALKFFDILRKLGQSPNSFIS